MILNIFVRLFFRVEVTITWFVNKLKTELVNFWGNFIFEKMCKYPKTKWTGFLFLFFLMAFANPADNVC